MNPATVSTDETSASSLSASYTYASKLASWEEAHLMKAYDTPGLLPKHKIFISHSGRQKDFAEQLCEDLETHGYYPFFDKRNDSLPKGEKFPPLIFKAARECLLAIVLISEDFFTRSKWPMLELTAFVQAQETRKDLRILPVLLDHTTIEDLGNTEKWSKVWIKWGKEDKHLMKTVIAEWDDAVRALRPINLILKSSYEGEVQLRKAIVKIVHETLLPDVRSYVLNVQGRERLCKEVRSMFEEPPSTSRPRENVAKLGLYGIGGAGKSTLCMIMTEYVRSEFHGRVCVVELGKEVSIVNLQRQVLRQLCKDNEDFLDKHLNTEYEGLSRLKERIGREQVFLAIDNVSDDTASVKIAKSFLRLKFHPKSMLLVTSRSYDVLCRYLDIPEERCMRCPSVTKEEAQQLLHEQLDLTFDLLDTEQMQVLEKTVELCFFECYHPLALQVLSAQLGTDPTAWREIKLDLQWTSDLEHPLFYKIETNYKRLPDQHTRDMFMDIALFTPESLCRIDDIILWLQETVNPDHHVDDIKQTLKTLRVKALLEIWNMEDETLRIHELYRALAERYASVDNPIPRFIYQRGAVAAPRVLVDHDRALMAQRAAFVDAKFEVLDLEACSKLQILTVRRCEKLRALCIQRLGYLVHLEVAECAMKNLDLNGLANLKWLHVSSCKDLMKLDVGGGERLQHVLVSKCTMLEALNFEKCFMINSASILHNDKLTLVNLGSGRSLKCLTLWFCASLVHVKISGVAHLTTLKKRGCYQLMAIQGGDIMCGDLQCIRLEKWGKLAPTFIGTLEISVSLQVLDIWHTCMSRLPDLRTCLNLQELMLSDIDVLLDQNNDQLIQEYEKLLCASDEDMELPISLEDLRIQNCRNVVVMEMFSKVRGLRNLRLLSLTDVRVGWPFEINGVHGVVFRWAIEEEYARINKSYEEKHQKFEARLLEDEIALMHRQLSKGLQHRTSITCSLNKIKHRIQKFLESKITLSQSEHMREPSFKQELGRMFWSSMSKTVQMRGSPCWSVEQIILKTCNNCDSLCEFLQQELLWDCPQVVEFCQKAHVEEIYGQLFFLTSKQLNELVLDQFVLTTWERIIIEKVSGSWSPPTRSFGNITRLKALLQRLETLRVQRGWQSENWIKDGEELRQFAYDWLLACRVWSSLELWRGCPAKHSEIMCEFGELLRDFKVIFRTEVVKLNQDDIAIGNFDTISHLIRFWKVHRWLQEVRSFLSEHCMQEQTPEPDLPANDLCQLLGDIKRQLVGPFAFRILEFEADVLIVKLREDWPDMESLVAAVGVESDAKDRTRKYVDSLCKLTMVFFKNIKTGLVPHWREDLGASMIEVEMQLWQCCNLLNCHPSFHDKTRIWKDLIADLGSRLHDRIVCSGIKHSLHWAERLSRKLTEEIEFWELGLDPSNRSYALIRWERRVEKLVTLLTEEFRHLWSVLTCHETEDLCRAELKDWWERAGLMLCVRLVNFVTTCHQLQRSLEDLRTQLHFFNEPFPTPASERRMLSVGKLSAVVVGGGHAVKLPGNRQNHTTDYSLVEQQQVEVDALNNPRSSTLNGAIGGTRRHNLIVAWVDFNWKQLNLPLSQCSRLCKRCIVQCDTAPLTLTVSVRTLCFNMQSWGQDSSTELSSPTFITRASEGRVSELQSRINELQKRVNELQKRVRELRQERARELQERVMKLEDRLCKLGEVKVMKEIKRVTHVKVQKKELWERLVFDVAFDK